jgi:hypothetical protein
VNNTFAGLYAYQKWAKIRLYANLYTITNGQQFNKTTNPGWQVNLFWTNTTLGGSTNQANALYAIALVNTTPVQTLLPGQSFSFIQSPAAYKVTFIGETLGTGGFDPVTLTSKNQGNSYQYQNLGVNTAAAATAPTILNVTEPMQQLQVTSSISQGFTYAGVSSGVATYDLTPYQLVLTNNAMNANAADFAGGNWI